MITVLQPIIGSSYLDDEILNVLPFLMLHKFILPAKCGHPLICGDPEQLHHLYTHKSTSASPPVLSG